MLIEESAVMADTLWDEGATLLTPIPEPGFRRWGCAHVSTAISRLKTTARCFAPAWTLCFDNGSRSRLARRFGSRLFALH